MLGCCGNFHRLRAMPEGSRRWRSEAGGTRVPRGGGRARDSVVPRLSPVPLCPSRCPQPLPPPRADSPPPQPGCRRRRRVPGRAPGPAAAASSRICRRGGGPRASPPLAGLFFPVLAPAGEVGRAKGGGTPFPPPLSLSLSPPQHMGSKTFPPHRPAAPARCPPPPALAPLPTRAARGCGGSARTAMSGGTARNRGRQEPPQGRQGAKASPHLPEGSEALRREAAVGR